MFKEMRMCLANIYYLLNGRKKRDTYVYIHMYVYMYVLDGSTDFPTRVNAVGGTVNNTFSSTRRTT